MFGVVAFALEMEEQYTSSRRVEEFNQRVSMIAEGMRESEVRSVAGAPEEFVPNVSQAADSDRLEWCRGATATTALIYSVQRGGWLQTKLDIPAGVVGRIVCLDGTRRVVKIYSHSIDY